MGHSLHVTRQLSIPAQESRRRAVSCADKNIRIVPDVSVTGAQGSSGLLDSMLALVAREKHDQRAA